MCSSSVTPWEALSPRVVRRRRGRNNLHVIRIRFGENHKEINNHSNKEEAERKQIQNAQADFPLIELVRAQIPGKQTQDQSNRLADGPAGMNRSTRPGTVRVIKRLLESLRLPAVPTLILRLRLLKDQTAAARASCASSV